jgi:hypothetical protein
MAELPNIKANAHLVEEARSPEEVVGRHLKNKEATSNVDQSGNHSQGVPEPSIELMMLTRRWRWVGTRGCEHGPNTSKQQLSKQSWDLKER